MREGTKIDTHWCLARYLLDGHHKLFAAANDQPVRLLSFLSVDDGICNTDDIKMLRNLL